MKTGGWRKMHNEELHIFYSSNVIREIKSYMMRQAEHVERMGRRKMRTESWLESLKGKDQSEI
jgi:hypothetical protein